MAKNFKVGVEFKGKDKVSAPLGRMTLATKKFGRAADKSFRRANRGSELMRRNFGRMKFAGIATGVAVGAAFIKGAQVGSNFEHQVAIATTRINSLKIGSEEFIKTQNDLKKAAKAAGAATMFTATQSAEALTNLTMAGFNAKEAVAALPVVIDAATAANIELAEATEMTTKVMSGFGLAVANDPAQLQKNLTRVADTMVAGTNAANMSMVDLFETMKDAAPLSAAAGQSIESTVAIIGALANAGLSGTRAGTGVKNMLIGLASSGSKAGKIFKRLKIPTMFEENGVKKFRKMKDVFGDFKDALDGIDENKKLEIIFEMFGKIGAPTAVNLIAKAGGELERLDGIMADVGGTSARVAGVLNTTTLGSFRQLKSSIESIAIGVFGNEKDGLQGVIDNLTKSLRKNAPEIIKEISSITKTFLNLADVGIKSVKAVSETIEGVRLSVFGEDDDTAGETKRIGLLNNMQRLRDAKKRSAALGTFRPEFQVKNIPGFSKMTKEQRGDAAVGLHNRMMQGIESGNLSQGEIFSPQERATEQRTISENKLIIEDKTGKAKLEGKPNKNISMPNTGGF